MFADSAKIYVRSGKGGDGHVSFRRELYVPNGGPDGGDGGDGGDVIFLVDPGLNTLADFRNVRKYKAGDGSEGGKKRCHGKNGADIVIKVPPGTVIKDSESGKVIVDMGNRKDPLVFLKGGHGGKGNQHYATPTMQAPKYAQPGEPAVEMNLLLELKMIADVGLVGFPSVGKSTILSRVSNARPKIADYPFTTLIPNLGVVSMSAGRSFVMADIPGIIQGASQGVGLGLDFLKAIERTRVILHVVDAAGVDGRDPFQDIPAINSELKQYSADLLNRPTILCLNKLDLLPEKEQQDMLEQMKREFSPIPVISISAATGQGIPELLELTWKTLEKAPREVMHFNPEISVDQLSVREDLAVSVTRDPRDITLFHVEGPKIEKMLGYTNLEDARGFRFFQDFMEKNGIIKELKRLGMQEGDTVQVYGHAFTYYDDHNTEDSEDGSAENDK